MYDVEALMKKYPTDKLVPENPHSEANPQLREFLAFGYCSELCRALLDQAVPEPYASIALVRVPVAGMMAAAMNKAVEMYEDICSVDAYGRRGVKTLEIS